MSNRLIGSLWTIAALTASGLLLSSSLMMLIKRWQGNSSFQATALPTPAIASQPQPSPSPQLGPRHQLSYQEWVDLLNQEARVAARNQPDHLTVLLGDSISLWFPPQLLPAERTWLNQGISGETTAGLLRRLDLLEGTHPETIFLMIGINDLIRGVRDDTIVANHVEIIQALKRDHPDTRLVVQSILPHAAGNATWEGRDRLLAIPNSRVQQINARLRIVAHQEAVEYLDLYSLFADTQGNLQLALSTDGLHLNEQGYWVWRTVLELYSNLVLDEDRADESGRLVD